jgi:hypothetical protein
MAFPTAVNDAKDGSTSGKPNLETGNAMDGGGVGGTYFAQLPSELQQSYSTFVALLNRSGTDLDCEIVGIILGFQEGATDSLFFNYNLTDLLNRTGG